MSTPTTAEVREGWQKFSAWKRVPTTGAEQSGAEFDAWLTDLASVPAILTREQIAETLYYHWLGTAAALEWNAWESKHPATKAPWHGQADAILSLLTDSEEN